MIWTSFLAGITYAYLASGYRCQFTALPAFDWNDRSPDAISAQSDVDRLELIAHEVDEGLRPESDLITAALDVYMTRTPLVINREVFLVP